MDAPLRLFLALWPDPAQRSALAAVRDGAAWPTGTRPVADADLHLTLHFLGSLPAARAPALRNALAVPFTPFTLWLDRPANWQPGLAVLEPAAIPPALTALHTALAQALVAHSLAAAPRPYRPHVTLARHAGATLPPAPAAAIPWQVDGYVLAVSHAGQPYSLLHRYI